MRIPAVLRAVLLAVALAQAPVLTQPVLAQSVLVQSADDSMPGPDKPISEQLEEAIRGLVESVEPALERLRDTFRVFERVDSLEHYEEPEILPNGDIIIRRKPDAPALQTETPDEPESPDTTDPDPGVRT